MKYTDYFRVDRSSRDWDWLQDAACRGLDVSIFYLEPGGDSMADSARAKAICKTCPVKEPCLEYALRTNELFGIWGGATREERADIRRQRRMVNG
jgi:WhiB family redox-sensing transcriptional regulator